MEKISISSQEIFAKNMWVKATFIDHWTVIFLNLQEKEVLTFAAIQQQDNEHFKDSLS